MTLAECVRAWEQIGIARGDNPLLVLLTDAQRSQLLDCQVTEGCERGRGHCGVCIVPKGSNGPWEVHLNGCDPEAFTGDALGILSPRTLKGITG